MADQDIKDDQNSNSKEASEEKKKNPALDEWKKLENEIMHDLDTNPRYVQYFDKYESVSVKTFKSIYAYRKMRALLYGQPYKNEFDEYETLYSGMAEDKLWEIQQRKLFDLQIRWRAELIKIPEIQVTYDFLDWSEKIQICPFLPPITQGEFDLYMSFIENSGMGEIDSRGLRWQEYEDFIQQYNNIDEGVYFELIPSWYEFYEMKTGLGSLYMLEDIRGRKEEFYCSLQRKEWQRDYELKNIDKPKPEPDNRPLLDYKDETIIEFMQSFENGKTIGLMTARMKQDEIADDPEFNEALNTLQLADEKVPVDFNEDWRQGVIDAANNYIKKKLLVELPKAYKRYLFRINSGLGFTPEEIRNSIDIVTHYKEMILNGRELNGEPRDFNF